MKNVFSSRKHIFLRYDIKGSLYGRLTPDTADRR